VNMCAHTMKAILAHNISVHLGGKCIVENVSFSVNQGEFVCITGPNGAGKTTMLKALLDLVSYSSGEIFFFGDSLASAVHEHKIGYLPQKNATINQLFPATAEEVIISSLVSAKDFPKQVTKKERQLSDRAFQMLEIERLKQILFSELSGGQQQKVLLARALAHDPKLLIMDEPSTALDPESREEFFSLVKTLNIQKGTAVLIVTHDMDYVGRYANTLLVLDRTVRYFGNAEAYLVKHNMTHHHDYE